MTTPVPYMYASDSGIVEPGVKYSIIQPRTQITNTNHLLFTKTKFTHKKWLENPKNAFLNKSEDAKKCVKRSKCSDHGHGQAGGVRLLRDRLACLCLGELDLPFSG